MHKPPAFQFYTNDFLGGTVRFTAEEVGAYLLLLIEQWENGYVKEEDFEEVSRISKDKLNRVLSKFIKTKKGFINKKLEEVRRAQKKHRENNSKNGKLGAQKRWSATTLKINELNSEAIFSPLAKNNSSSSTSSSIKENIIKEKNLNGELVGLEITNSIEYCDRTFQRKYSPDQIQSLWKGFLINGVNGYYPNRSEKVKHFRNWIKLQPYKQKEENNFYPQGPTLPILNG